MRYDGSGWYDATPPSVDSIQGILYSIYGRGNNDIWAAGYEYAIHYDGAVWTTYKVADSMLIPHMGGNNDFIYATAYSPWGRNVSILLVFRGDHFQVIDSTNQESDAKFGSWLWVQPTKLTTFYNGVISTAINADGTVAEDRWLRELTTATYFGPPSVQSASNVLAVGQFNLIYHFDGADWAPIEITVPNHTVSPFAFFSGVWLNNNEAFVCDIDEGIIYHGR